MMTSDEQVGSANRKVTPDDLTEGFERLGLAGSNSVVMHASLESMGIVEGGAAIVLHRLLSILGKSSTLLMPVYTSITRHSRTHENYTKAGCWCQDHEDRHLPFIPELQPDKNLGSIAYRLCSWPSSRRSRHPAYSFVAVGKNGDELVRDYSLVDPLLPVKRLLKHDPLVLTVGVGFEQVTAIHLAEQERHAAKSVMERALTISSIGRNWVDVTTLGCSAGFEKLRTHLGNKDTRETAIGLAPARLYSAKTLVERADSLLDKEPSALLCDEAACLSCGAIRKVTN